MAGFMNLHDHLYMGTLTAKVAMKPGTFVTADFVAGQVDLPATNVVADGARTYFVTNTPDTIDEELVADTDFALTAGRHARIKSLKVGDIITTDMIAAGVTYASVNPGDVFVPSASGLLDVIGARTPVIKLVVKEKVSVYGKNGLKLVVTQA